jgi:pSer/pThr/pTyr-binding forkhead associated (FHA) protein
MIDPRLQSIHLESAPRREEFRKARQRVQGALGELTMLGGISVQPGDSKDKTQLTGLLKAPPGIICWLLFRGRQLPLNVGLNSVGRLPDNDVVLDDETISRRHCAIVVHSDLTAELIDVASKNGTMINGNRLNGSAPLHDGDEVMLCQRKLIFVMKSGAPTMDPVSYSGRPALDITLAG